MSDCPPEGFQYTSIGGALWPTDTKPTEDVGGDQFPTLASMFRPAPPLTEEQRARSAQVRRAYLESVKTLWGLTDEQIAEAAEP